MIADRCETTAEKQALSEECCNHFRRELYLLLPLLLPLPAGTMQRKLPKVIEKILYVFVGVFFLLFEGLGHPWSYLGRQRITDHKKEAITQKVPGRFEVIFRRFLIQMAFEIASIFQ